MNETTRELLKIVTGIEGELEGAYNIREDSGCAARHSTENIKIESKTDKPGIDITIAPGTKESVFIPAFVTHGEVTDLVYNDFFIGEGADIMIMAGCGVHTQDQGDAVHNGIHRFFIGKNARVVYVEKQRVFVKDTDNGKQIAEEINDLMNLLKVYNS